MVVWKLPKKAKIYEALSAIGDGRVTLSENRTAKVVSSNGDKTYTVEWSEDEQSITSNDNASYWQGYLGYPILAILMLKNKIVFDKTLASVLSGIHWKEINKKFRNKYDEAIEFVLSSIETKGIKRENITREVDYIMDQISKLELKRFPSKRRPPSGK
jgi:hypothetical protein